MSVEELKKLMSEIKDMSEKDPEVSAEKVLDIIQGKLAEKMGTKI